MTRFGRIMAAVFTLLALTVPTAKAAPAGAGLVSGSFRSYSATARAVTYDKRVPAGALVTVARLSSPHRTLVTLSPMGLAPNRGYGAHVHTGSCGRLPADAGPHYQHVPSADPAFANPDNEIWLDFTTDATGTAIALTTVDWTFTGRAARSVVIHEHRTHHGGAAGARVACLNVNFR